MSFQHEYPYGDVHEMNLDWLIQTMQEFINSERAAGNTPTVASVRSFFTHKYPYGDIHELNLDWVIQTALRMEEIGDSVEGDIGALQTRMTAAEGNISTLDNTVSGLSDSIGQIETEMEEIQGDVTALETTVGQHTTQITALDAKIDSQVVANPADAATDTLNKIEIAGAVYGVEGSGGSEVEANPAGTPTDTLEKIGIDGTIYEVGGSKPVSKTVTGNPIHIEDAAGAPIVSGTVAFEPIQDLHGYDKPWAGGAGKNLIEMAVATIKSLNSNYSWNGNVGTLGNLTITILTDNAENVIGIKLYGSTSSVTFINIGNAYGLTIGTSYVLNSNYTVKLNSSSIIPSSYPYTWVCDRTEESFSVRIPANESVDTVVYPIFCLSSNTNYDFEPYSNICPIEGYTDCELEVADDATSPTVTNTYTIDLDGTRYGGKVYPVTGKMSVGMGRIASYAGETIGEPWLSDRDEYVAGTTPTTGAEVVYTLASPTIVQLTPQQIRTLEGTNNISTNMTSMSLEYITQDYQSLVKLIERSVGHHYSEQERVVGTWIGKTLYEKVVDFGALPNNNTKAVPHGILNLEEIIAIQSIAIRTSLGQYYPVPYSSLNSTSNVSIYIDATNISIVTGFDRSDETAKVILQYTKTAD